MEDIHSITDTPVSSLADYRIRSVSSKSITPSINSAFSGMMSSLHSTPLHTNFTPVQRPVGPLTQLLVQCSVNIIISQRQGPVILCTFMYWYIIFIFDKFMISLKTTGNKYHCGRCSIHNQWFKA